MNEPVAWIKQGKMGYPVLEFDKPFRYQSYAIQNPPIPLYTHPAKTLTDEEIKEVYGEYFDIENCDWLHLQCIHAILKKASEK